ncbi:MAG: flavodoxin family protein [Firmicutes bacterium]|nr:flavodoxin family protein [Bacillota bacterium]
MIVMRLVAILGSPRLQGNTALLLREVLAGAKEAFASLPASGPIREMVYPGAGGAGVQEGPAEPDGSEVKAAAAEGGEELEIEVYQVNRMKIKPCQGCNRCAETGHCIYHDDMDRIFRAAEILDGLILASPTYFYSLSAQTKAAIDRFQSFWARKYVLKQPMPDPAKRPGVFLSTAGLPFRPEIFEPSRAVARVFFRLNGVAYQEELLVCETDKVPVQKNDEARKRAREAGRALIRSWAAARAGS